MRFKSQNMHSHPVFEQGSDMPSFIEGDIIFSMKPKYVRDGDGVEVIECNFSYEITEPTIAALVAAGKARVGVCLDCREAILRESIWLDNLHEPQLIEASRVTGKTEFTLFVVAIEDIPFYTSENFVPFFRGSYEVKVGEILGFTMPRTFFMERESFKPLSSVLDILLSEELHGEFDVDTSEQKITILLDPYIYEAVQKARTIGLTDKATASYLNCGVYLHGVTAAGAELKRNPDLDSSWARVLRNTMESMGLSTDLDAHVIAQRILRQPMTQFATYIREPNGE